MCSVTISCGLIKKLWSSLCGSPKHQHSALSPLQRYDYEIQAWGRYAVSRLSIRSCHEGLWAFPAIRSRWTHSYQPLPFRPRSATRWNPEGEREGEREKEKERERFATQHYRGWKTQSWMASRMQKMISQQPPIRPTPDKPWAPPLADATKLLKQLDKAKVAIPSKTHSLSGFPCCKGWSPSGNPSEPFQRNLKHLRRLRVKYYLNIWTNPQGQSQVRPSFCLEHLTSPK